MDIVSTKNILIEAQRNKYAVPAFNVYNLETMQAVLEGVYKMKSPVIIATTPGTVNYAEMEYLVAIARAAGKKYDIPIGLHLDHCSDIDFIKKCIIGGYKSVMIDGSMMTYEENIRVTKEVVEFAHKYDATVEAELGRVGGVEDYPMVYEKEVMLTDPKIAQDFVRRTNIDSLAVAIGTAHGLYKFEPKLDFNRLKEIRDIIDIPIVLHGGSGVPDESIIKAVEYGICKVNIATELKKPFAESIKNYFKENPETNDPRHYFGPGKELIREIAMEKIRICGSDNRL